MYNKPMNLLCLGGGPAGLYFALSMKLRNPAHQVTVLERNRADDTFGWGVVLSDETMQHLRANDLQSASVIYEEFAHWDDVEVIFGGERHRSGGHGFCGISRLRLLQLLQQRCQDLGVELRYETAFDATDVRAWQASYDLVVAADGLNSQVRTHFADAFQPQIDQRKNRFVWLGVQKNFEAFTFIFERTQWGWFWAHAYRFDATTSTFIVECTSETWHAAGFEHLSKEESVALCQEIFKAHLDDQPLLDNARHLRGSAIWLNFLHVSCAHWYDQNLVLLGDAAHTAHFSIGSGTKLALEDAINLADQLNSGTTLSGALEHYQKARSLEVLKITNAARNSTEWFENVHNYTHFKPLQFTYALLTRSQRVSHENLRMRDADWLTKVEAWFASTSLASSSEAKPPMFVPYQVRSLTLRNRVVVSPMSMYSASDGMPDDFHLVHYGNLAKGGAGLLFTEMTNVCANGRITLGCAGIWNDSQAAAWQRICDFVHRHTDCKIAIQLGHAGPKGATRVPWEGDNEPLDVGAWPLVSASATPYSTAHQIPEALSETQMAEITALYVQAAERALAAGFDWLELHCAHGYLLSAFLTPLLNQRTDAYGGSLKNRLRFPLAVFEAVRATWPERMPMSVRTSATDWHPAGINTADAVQIAQAFHQAGSDIINVSAGQTSPDAQPVYGRMFQTPLADRIRNAAGVPTMAVGNIFEADHINSILASGRADLCCLGRPHLADPYWTLHTAAEAGLDQPWPKQYLPAKAQLMRNISRASGTTL